MAVFKFFRIPRHQKFNYIPRYYDPEKEAIKERVDQAMKQQDNSAEAMKSRISSGLRRGHGGDHGLRGRYVFRSNLTVVGIIIVLMILSYYYLPLLISVLE